LAGSTTKKAILRRYDKEPLAGYVNPLSFLNDTGVDLLSADGKAATVPYGEIKTVAFVRDFEATDEAGRRVFHTRPKMAGLWVSFQFRDGEVIEGILPNNLLQVEKYGFTMIPPDPYGNNQRVFVPKAALRSAEVLGVVGSPLKKRRAKTAPKEQIELFEE
jgi:hypothetical protein